VQRIGVNCITVAPGFAASSRTSDSARSSANAVSAETAAIENASTVVPTLFHQIAHEFPGVLDDGTLR